MKTHFKTFITILITFCSLLTTMSGFAQKLDRSSTKINAVDYQSLSILLASSPASPSFIKAQQKVMLAMGMKADYLRPLMKSYLDMSMALASSKAATPGVVKLCVAMNPVYSRRTGLGDEENKFFGKLASACIKKISDTYPTEVQSNKDLLITLNRSDEFLQQLNIQGRLITYHQYKAMKPKRAVLTGKSFDGESYHYLSSLGARTIEFIGSNTTSSVKLVYADGSESKQVFSFSLKPKYSGAL